jgi:hypothetical protein
VSTKIHEGLLDYDFDFKPRPVLAESWTVAPEIVTASIIGPERCTQPSAARPVIARPVIGGPR